jgi:glutamine synthetase
MLSVDELRAMADAGTLDTVVTALTDMRGRLMGKRIDRYRERQQRVRGR